MRTDIYHSLNVRRVENGYVITHDDVTRGPGMPRMWIAYTEEALVELIRQLTGA